MKRIGLFILVLCAVNVLFAQENTSYRYEKDFLSPEFFTGRRNVLREQMPDSSMAILFSSPVRNFSNDVDFPYHQDPGFYYLTGFTQPSSILLLFKSEIKIAGITTNEILFISPRNIEEEQWTGRLATTEEAKVISGIKTVFIIPAFDSLNISATDFKKILYRPLPKGVVDDRNDSTDLFDLVESFKKKFSFPPENGDNFSLSKMLTSMREIKQPEELTLLRRAISISNDGHIAMMKGLTPGMKEYQVEAIGEYVFAYSGAEEVGYPSICGSGENSCILHYESNRRTLNDGDLILLDMGAEYHGYSADITRTLPVSGKFTVPQRIIYDIVRKAQDSAFAQCKPGNAFKDPHKAAEAVIKQGLLEFGIIADENDYSKYFFHGTSHYLGLDVHDWGSYSTLKAGNVITIEPGIYIPANSPCDPKWWNIGVRIEDDVLITAEGYEILSASLPSRSEDVEKTIKK